MTPVELMQLEEVSWAPGELLMELWANNSPPQPPDAPVMLSSSNSAGP